MADIVAAVTYVLKNEDRKLSGIVTTDRGGKTRFGIAQKFHPNLDEAFYTCPKDEALTWADKIYKTEYAAPLLLDQVKSQPIANKLLDVAINCGVPIAAKFAQTGVSNLGQHVEIDKHIGPATIAALNSVDTTTLMTQLIVLSQNYYREIAIKLHASPDEIASWLTRAGKPGI